MDPILIRTLADIVRNGAPLLIAGLGEMITERAGVVNLSLDGTILLAAMAAFAVALETSSIGLGIGAAMLVGMLIALIIIASSVFLRLDQIAVGFVLTLLAADLSTFVGRDYANLPGQQVEIPYAPVPVLKDIEFLGIGEIFFQHNLLIYFSVVLLFVVWAFIYHTRPGLQLRGLGEHPQAAYVRGIRVQFWRFVYVAIGGALVGLAGATYSLSIRLGWKENLTIGNGWIALAIVIFGGWRPFRVAFGVYLIVGLRALALELQKEATLNIPVQIINMTPWVLMLLTLMFVSSGFAEWLLRLIPERARPFFQGALRANPPAALGTNFEKE
ncbi:MAG: ABC transporter permease [Chloroflexi bacterium]|nr:ABC transporter permease [Chloroflexota bacterium]